MRRYALVLALISFLVANPIHLPFTLPWLAQRTAGTALGDLLTRYESTILAVGTGYFMVSMVYFYYWLWTVRRRGRSQTPAARSPSSNGRRSPDEPYRGPGGGKRPPRPSRRGGRRVRRR